MNQLLDNILSNPYENYIYSYPHKKAYREFDEPIDLKQLWSKGHSQNITLYVHIPFCNNRCGYCNLFSSIGNDKVKISTYVDKLIDEIKGVREFFDEIEKSSPFSSVIFGGGTPTILSDYDLNRLIEAISTILNINLQKVFFSVEVSPRTLTEGKLEILKKHHIDRISIGVQSFRANELSNIYRNESVTDLERSLELLFVSGVAIKNLDLIYGIPLQTLNTWEASLIRLLGYSPEEVYLYPMYIREKTGLYTKYNRDTQLMLTMYQGGKKILEENGYIQTSMRNFIRGDMKKELFPEYGCQENEMIGIGCGARSYLGNIHYSRKYGVEQKNINKIIEDYMNESSYHYGSYGYILNESEMKRRYILKSILKVTGLDLDDYAKKFHGPPIAEFTEMQFLMQEGFLCMQDNKICPTEKGLMYSDAIGDMLISEEVRHKISNFIE